VCRCYNYQKDNSRQRGPVTFATLDDGTEKIEIILGSDVMQSMHVELNNKDIFIVDGKVTVDNSREVLYGLAKKIEVTISYFRNLDHDVEN